MQRDTKDPQSVLDYAWDWSAWLSPGETITSHTVTVASGVGLNIDSHSATTNTVTAWLSAGVTGTSYTVTCHITTSDSRQDDLSRTINVRDK